MNKTMVNSPADLGAVAPMRVGLSAVVPCYNEEDCIDTLHARLSAACRDAAGDDYEIVLINDGSSDRTWPMMQALAAGDSHVVAIDLARNHGHQLALTAGLDLCRGDLVFVIDADLQDPPELLGPMLETMRAQGADVVYGQRRTRAGETAFKKHTASAFYRFLRSMTEVDIPVDTGDFRLMSRRALDVFRAMPEHNRFVRGMVAWIGMKQVPYLYDREARFAGTTKYPLKKMVRLTFDALTGFSMGPLRLASYIGFGLGAAGFLFILYLLALWSTGVTVPGWTSLMGVVVILGSVQMLLIGLLGEYLGRLYMQSKQRPLFVIKEVATQAALAPSMASVQLGFVHPGSLVDPASRQSAADTPAANANVQAAE